MVKSKNKKIVRKFAYFQIAMLILILVISIFGLLLDGMGQNKQSSGQPHIVMMAFLIGYCLEGLIVSFVVELVIIVYLHFRKMRQEKYERKKI